MEASLTTFNRSTEGHARKVLQAVQCSNVVVIDPDLAASFPNAKAVNDALREVLSRRARKGGSVK